MLEYAMHIGVQLLGLQQFGPCTLCMLWQLLPLQHFTISFARLQFWRRDCQYLVRAWEGTSTQYNHRMIVQYSTIIGWLVEHAVFSCMLRSMRGTCWPHVILMLVGSVPVFGRCVHTVQYQA